MAENKILNLPALKRNHNVPQLDVSGQWISRSVNLETVADGLPVDPEKAFNDEDEPIRAVPDPWAQATAFAEHLRKAARVRKSGDEQIDELTRRAEAQWRGLLGVLALGHLHPGDISITAERVPLNDGSLFSNVLTTLTPEMAIAGQVELWREPWLIMFQDKKKDPAGLALKALGMTNPACLVSPGRDSHRIDVPNLAWARGDRLLDPLDPSVKLSGRELSILFHFVSQLAREVGNHGGLVAPDIAKLLADYVGDIQQRLGRLAEPLGKVSNTETKSPELYKSLWSKIELEPSRIEGSESLVLTPAGMSLQFDGEDVQNNKIKGFILVDEAVATAHGKDPSQILVWKLVDLATVLNSKSALEHLRTDAFKQNYIVLTADDLLTDRASRLTKDAMIDSHPDGLKDMILPVKPLSLLLTSNLHDAVSASAADSRVSVTLSLRLASEDNRDGLPISLTRHYAKQPSGDGEHLLVAIEDWDFYNCQVWPNFRSTAWNSYLARFLYPAALANKITRPNRAISAKLMREVVAKASDSANAARVLEDFNEGRKMAFADDPETPLFAFRERLTGEDDSFIEELQFSNTAFDAIYYTDALGDQRREAPVGLVLLKLAEISEPNRSTKIAIDFGTTNTVGAVGDMNAQPITFKNRLVLPVRKKDDGVHEAELHNIRHQFTEFLPPEARSTPIPTVAIPKLPYDSKEKLWVFRNLIFFYTTQPPSDGAEEKELDDFLKSTENAHFNLKWSKVSAEQDAAKDFLTQFILLTGAELLSEKYNPATSTWFFSVPEALGLSQRNDFHDNVIKALQAVGQKDHAHYPDPFSEGLSAGSYMLATKQFISDKLNIVLDIGGGTTDITIWNGKTPIWRGSVQLAGRNFFTSLLVQNSEILEAIGLSSWARSLNAFDQQKHFVGAEKRRTQMAEMLFSGRSTDGSRPDLQRALNDFWSRICSEDGEILRHASLVYLGGVAWYCGKVVRHLMEQGLLGDFDPETMTGRATELVSQAAFAVCGRGGGIFKLMHGERRRPDAETDVTKALSVFGQAVGLEDCKRPRFSASDAPKLEVVRGMLNANSREDELKLSAEQVEGLSGFTPFGLALNHGGGTLAADDELSHDSLPEDFRSVDLAGLESFLEAFENCTGIALDTRPGELEAAHGRIASEVLDKLVDVRDEIERAPRNQKSRVALEPPFLTALRELVDIMALPKEERSGLLDVWGAD